MKPQVHTARPTWRALALLIIALALACAGGVLRAPEPLVGAIACVVAMLAGGLAVALAPDTWLMSEGDTVWERIDRAGNVVERVTSGDAGTRAQPPVRRGVWRRSRTGLVGDWLWTWTRPATDADASEVVIAPAMPHRPGVRYRSGSPLRADDQAEVATIRRYEPGDPLRQIAWHASARHGRLMSHNLGGADGRATFVLVDVISGHDADALASAAWQLMEAAPVTARSFISDGTTFAGASDAKRLLAQLEVMDSPTAPAERAEEALRKVAAFTRRLAEVGSWNLVLVTDAAGGALEQALRQSRLGAKCEVIHAAAGQMANNAASTTPSHPYHRATMPFAIRIAVCLLELPCLAIIIWAAAQLVEPGTWTALAATGCATCAISTSLPRRNPKPWGHLLAALGWLVLGLVVSACIATNASVLRDGSPLTPATYGAALLELAHQGATELYSQWVPLRIPSASASLTLCVGTTLTLPFIRLSLGSHRTRPLAAAAALVALATCERFLGTEGLMPLAVVATACGLSLMALGSPATSATAYTSQRASRATRIASSVAALLLACGLGFVLASPTSRALSQLDLGMTPGTSPLSATSVNPLLDLSRSLESRSDVALFSYTTSLNQPLHLRLATIDDLAGDTWKLAADTDTAQTATQTYDDGSPLTNAGSPTPEAHAQRTRTTITPRALTSAYLPAPSNTVRASAGLAGAGWTPDGALVTSGTSTSTYTVEGLYVQPLTSSNTASQALMYLADLYTGMDATPALELSVYLSLPDQLPQSVEGVIAASRQAGLAEDGAYDGDPPQRARAVMCWLLSYFETEGFTYTTDAPSGDGNNLEMVAQFLTTRRGYCTHYAAALAVLGRALGVPTRIALGYAGGTRTSDGSYVATNQNLHAWCEAYIEGIGWLSFDATPSAGSGTGTLGAGASEAATPTARTGAASPTTVPTNNAVETDSEEQETTARQNNAGSATDRDTHATKPFAGNPVAILVVAAALLVTAIGIAAWLARRRHIRDLIASGRPGAAIATWEAACKQARHAGAIWPKSATELDIAAAIKQKLATSDHDDLRALANRAEDLARAACDERYGKRRP